MAYEVTKTIAGRAYRYRVERVRDAATGKAHSRWTYLGRANAAAPAAPRPRRTDGRERLLDALERLLERTDFPAVTADAIAAEAGVAHGTFYRHFHDKRSALRAAFERVRERRGPVVDMLRDDVANADEARAALAAFVANVLGRQAQHPALLRAYHALSLRDDEVAHERRDRKAGAIAAVARHLRALDRRGLATVHEAEGVAAGIFAMVEGLSRDAIVDGIPLDAARQAGAAAIVDRAVFGAVTPAR